jgi:ABC-type Mn2+/Zn2+ transport system ATPase subunit
MTLIPNPTIGRYGDAVIERSTSVIAEFADASVRYADVVALDRTSTVFESGSSIALVGANGSGKSTVLRLLAGLLAPSTGTVVRAPGVEAAFIAQQHGHHDWMPLPVDEVIRMGCYRARGLLGRVTRADRAEIRAVAERLDVDDLLRRSFSELSGGQRQRVLVAQALIGSPKLLLLDEPITGLDLPSQETILSIIDAEVASGATVVFSTHHLEEAKRAERVMLLAGCVIADGTPDAVLRPEHLATAFGGRLLRIGGEALLVDDHGHGHSHDLGDDHNHDDVGHRHLHQPEHAAEHRHD